MKENSSAKQPTHLERISDSCLAFRLDNQFISDNNYLFITPHTDFCRACFQRRYLTQMMTQIKSLNLHNDVLNLALLVDDDCDNQLWQAYSVADKTLLMSFELTPYEDCPTCGTQENVSSKDAKTHYQTLLKNKTTPYIDALKKQVSSFGFAHKVPTTTESGLPDPLYDKLLGNNYEAKVVFRMIAPDGRYADDSAIGFDKDKALSELKSLMEYLERYAFMMQLCRFSTKKYSDQIISKTLALYKKTASKTERKHIKSEACWGLNLSTREVSPIPRSFIFNTGHLRFIHPTSSGFGAHTDFKKSLCSSILELVERDAFIRFWHDPQRAFVFEPTEEIKSDINDSISVLEPVVDNETLTSNFFVIQSPTKLPVVLVTISSKDFAKPPSLCFGCGVGFTLNEALSGAIEELRQNTVNLVKGITVIDGFLTRTFTHEIESIPDRMNFYSTHIPRKKLTFLDNVNPLVDGIVEDAALPKLDTLVNRFEESNFEIYGIDCTPASFRDKNVFVTRAFSPQLYPLQFDKKGLLDIPTDPLGMHNELPHFFL